MIELTAGALSAMAPSALSEYEGGNGTFSLALNIACFVPFDQFANQATALAAKIKSTPAAEGIEEVMLPGEPETRTRRQRLLRGIPLPEETWNELQSLARQVGVSC